MESRNYFQCDIPSKAPMESRHFQTRFESVFKIKKDQNGKMYKQVMFGEILSRIQFDTGSELNPSQFLHMLDSSEKRIDFDFKLMSHLLNDDTGAKQIRARMNKYPNGKISINITMDTLLSEAFLSKITPLITKFGPNFIIELLEDFDYTSTFSSQDSIEHFRAVLNTLRRLKIQLALDDYPAKSNTEEFLALIPKKTLQIVKIDGDFIAKKMREAFFMPAVFQGKMKAVRNDILKNHPDVTIVCEKIENEKVFRYLVEAGFTYFQGFYLEKPVESSNLIRSVRNRTSECLK